MVIAPHAGGQDLHHVFVVQKFIIRVVDPADALGGAALVQIVQRQDHRLFAGLFADIIKDHGDRKGVVALGHHAHHADALHRFLRQTGLGEGGLFQRGGYGVHGKPHFVHHRHGGQLIINIKNAVVEHGEAIVRPLVPHRQAARLAVQLRGQPVRRRRGKAALFTADMPHMGVAHIVVPQRRAAAGTVGAVIHPIGRRGHVAGLTGDAVIDPRILRQKTRRAQLVSVEDQLGLGAVRQLQLAGHILGVGVALQGVPQDVGDDDIVAAHLGADDAGIVLVHLQHHGVRAAAVAQAHREDHGGGDAVLRVAADAVIGHGLAAGSEQVAEEVGRGGLAVGAGDADHRLSLADLPQEIRTQPHGKPARQIGRLTTQQPHTVVHALAGRQRQRKTKLHNLSYPAYKIKIYRHYFTHFARCCQCAGAEKISGENGFTVCQRCGKICICKSLSNERA